MRLVSLLFKIILLSTWTLLNIITLNVLSTIIAVVAVALPSADSQESRSSPSLTLPASATDIATNAIHVPNPNFNMTDLDSLVQTATSSAYWSCGLLRMDHGIYYDLIGDKTCQRSPRPISGSAMIDSGCTCIFYRL